MLVRGVVSEHKSNGDGVGISRIQKRRFSGHWWTVRLGSGVHLSLKVTVDSTKAIER